MDLRFLAIFSISHPRDEDLKQAFGRVIVEARVKLFNLEMDLVFGITFETT